MRLSRAGFFLILSVLLAPPLVTSCAVNPVTGQREFTLFSESQEIQIGRDADRDISASLGVYNDESLQQYVTGLGEQMAEDSERPDLPWTFRLIDDPVINAFALPGGFVYVTRGILAHFSSEAELAGVIGHEIGHVTARHGIQQVSRQQITQLGLGVGTVLFPELEGVGQLAGAGLGLLFLSYGRDAEREADDLGLNYMTALDYDPSEMAATFDMLYQASGGDEADRIPNWLSTHPDPLDRRDRILSRIQGGEVSGQRVERDAYLQRIEGMIWGPDPRQGFFRNGRFHHPDLAFRLDMPSGWKTLNQRSAVQAVSSQEDAIVVLTIDQRSSAAAAADAFSGDDGLTVSNRRSTTVGQLPAVRLDFRAAGQGGGSLAGTAAFVEHDGRVYRLLGYGVEAQWSQRRGAAEAAVTSFRPETDPAMLNVEPKRISIVRTDRDLTLQGFNSRYPSTVQLSTIATLNRLRPGDVIPAGTLVKRVTGAGPPS